MADMTNVDSEKILSTVNQLAGIESSILGQMQKIVEAINVLDSGWISSAKDEFLTRYHNDEDAMREMLDQFREISEQLKETAADLDKTESEILSNVSALG